VNFVEHATHVLDAATLRRLAALPVPRFAPQSDTRGGAPAARVVARWGGDLCGLLDAMTRGELVALAAMIGIDTAGRSPELRARLWDAGAAFERGGCEVAAALQPRPVLLGGHLVVQAPPRGVFPPAPAWPRPLPPARTPAPPADEPDTLDDLLAAADRLIGVRLGRRGRDKGAWGLRAAALLGVAERGGDEPDWRGDVEIKTVPVAIDRSSLAGPSGGSIDATGRWRVVEDPAIAMSAAQAIAKLQHTLWLARADVEPGDATIVSYYLLAWDEDIARLARRYLHDRPKGPRGTDQRGVYLSKRFFADAGLLATLNGPA
jgi:hypothetical protein